MQIRHATPQDLRAIMALYDGARRFMQQSGNTTQWANGYPREDIVQEDIESRTCYVCVEDGHIYAAFVLLLTPEPTYRRIEGAWLNDRPYGTLHRVASDGQKPRMTDAIIRWAFEKTGNLRGDTHEDNRVMQRAFERNGFERCGVIWVEDGTPRIAYQKQA